MNTTASRIDSVLKTKGELQCFVLVALILFILFVKCYMVVVNTEVTKAVSKLKHADIAKTTINLKR